MFQSRSPCREEFFSKTMHFRPAYGNISWRGIRGLRTGRSGAYAANVPRYSSCCGTYLTKTLCKGESGATCTSRETGVRDMSVLLARYVPDPMMRMGKSHMPPPLLSPSATVPATIVRALYSYYNYCQSFELELAIDERGDLSFLALSPHRGCTT